MAKMNVLHREWKEGQRARKEQPEQVAQVAPPVAKHGHVQDKAFAAETAAVTGESKSQINRHIARAEALGDDLDKVAGTSLDKGWGLPLFGGEPQPPLFGGAFHRRLFG